MNFTSIEFIKQGYLHFICLVMVSNDRQTKNVGAMGTLLHNNWRTTRQTDVTTKGYLGENILRNNSSNPSIVWAVTSLYLAGFQLKEEKVIKTE